MYRPLPMNDPSSTTTAQSTPNRAAVLSPLKYRRLTCAPLRPDQDVARLARRPAGERAAPPGRSRALRSQRTIIVVHSNHGGIDAHPRRNRHRDPVRSRPGSLQTVTEGVLTSGTSDPSYEPWIVDNDPTNGKGFESAVAYAVAAELGFGKDAVEWVPVTFDQIIAPGEKSFDVAINQVSISDERRANLDFSASYYDTAQAVVTLGDGPAARATSLADLADLRIGAMVGTTSAQVAEDTIAPTTDVQLFNDNDQVQ